MSMIASVVVGILWATQAAAAKPVEPQDPDRPALSLSELKGLRDNNIFSPPKPKRTEPSRKEDRREERREERKSEPARPKPAVLTGIIFDLASGTHQAIFEDRNSDSLKQFKEPKFLKAGAELAGYTLESVSPEKVVIKKGETLKDLKVGESFPDDGPKLPEGAAKAEPFDAAQGKPAVETKPLDDAAKEDVFKRLREKAGSKKNRSYDEP